MKIFFFKSKLILILFFTANGCTKNNLYKVNYNELDCAYGRGCIFNVVTKSKVLTFSRMDTLIDTEVTLSNAFINPLQLQLGHYYVSVSDKITNEINNFSIPLFDRIYYDENKNNLITLKANTANGPDQLNIPISIFSDYSYYYSYPFCRGVRSNLYVFPPSNVSIKYLINGLPKEIFFKYSESIKKKIDLSDSIFQISNCKIDETSLYEKSFPSCSSNTAQKILNNNNYWSVVCIDNRGKISGDFTTFIFNEETKSYNVFIKGRIINNIGTGDWFEFNEDGSLYEKINFDDCLEKEG